MLMDQELFDKKLDELHQCLKKKHKCEVEFTIRGFQNRTILNDFIRKIHDTSRIPYLCIAYHSNLFHL